MTVVRLLRACALAAVALGCVCVRIKHSDAGTDHISLMQIDAHSHAPDGLAHGSRSANLHGSTSAPIPKVVAYSKSFAGKHKTPNPWTQGRNQQAGLPCKSSFNCSLNGECTLGRCACDTGWKGATCSILDLLPARSIQGAYQPDQTSSWGGLPIKGPDGRYHLFVSQLVKNCMLTAWNPASEVVRAVADDPMGPYTYAETVFGTFHHNPTVRYLTPKQSGTGRPLYVIYMIGADRSPPSGSGSRCTMPHEGDAHHLEGHITVAWSESVLGPWKKSKSALISDGDPNAWDAMVTNPAPVFPFQNETAYIFYRGTQWPVNDQERIGVSKAQLWSGPFARLGEQSIFTGRHDDSKTFLEDPFVWRDHKGRGYKGLFHGHFDENGYLAFAEHIEGPWRFSEIPAYTNVIEVVGDNDVNMKQRERPQLLFDEKTGEPSILFTGVTPPQSSFYGRTYTFAQRVSTEGNRAAEQVAALVPQPAARPLRHRAAPKPLRHQPLATPSRGPEPRPASSAPKKTKRWWPFQ
mmetsp:Transcript_48915/g.140087  ORF Transcript_48915/g.140087 Transcript_48915/m.140087 type:complete len:521 (-) Transcript_48915:44-1606(-)